VGLAVANAKAAELRMSAYKDVIMSLSFPRHRRIVALVTLGCPQPHHIAIAGVGTRGVAVCCAGRWEPVPTVESGRQIRAFLASS
jgi:hypothetical protein